MKWVFVAAVLLLEMAVSISLALVTSNALAASETESEAESEAVSPFLYKLTTTSAAPLLNVAKHLSTFTPPATTPKLFVFQPMSYVSKLMLDWRFKPVYPMNNINNINNVGFGGRNEGDHEDREDEGTDRKDEDPGFTMPNDKTEYKEPSTFYVDFTICWLDQMVKDGNHYHKDVQATGGPSIASLVCTLAHEAYLAFEKSFMVAINKFKDTKSDPAREIGEVPENEIIGEGLENGLENGLPGHEATVKFSVPEAFKLLIEIMEKNQNPELMLHFLKEKFSWDTTDMRLFHIPISSKEEARLLAGRENLKRLLEREPTAEEVAVKRQQIKTYMEWLEKLELSPEEREHQQSLAYLSPMERIAKREQEIRASKAVNAYFDKVEKEKEKKEREKERLVDQLLLDSETFKRLLAEVTSRAGPKIADLITFPIHLINEPRFKLSNTQ